MSDAEKNQSHKSSSDTGAEISRVFRSTFPQDEPVGFRTGAWRKIPTTPEELKPLHSTLLHALSAAGKLEDKVGITLISEDDKELHHSYRWIHEKSKAVAAALEAEGVRRGDRVVMVLPTGFEFIVAFFAIERLGAVPCPSYPPSMLEKAEVSLKRITHVARHAGASFCVSNRMLQPLLGGIAHGVEGMHDVLTVESLFAHELKPEQAKTARARGTDPAFVQYTSGSTGNPKGVLLSHTNLVSNIHTIGVASQINRNDVTVSWLPLYHDMGLIGALLFSVYWRLPMALMSPTTFLMKPSRWLWAIHRHKGTLSPAPNFAYAMCVKRVRAKERDGLNLSSWRRALNGAEPISLKSLREFEQTYAPFGFRQDAMLPVYGLAESALAVTFPPPGGRLHWQTLDRGSLAAGTLKEVPEDAPGATQIVCVGKPVPAHEVRVVDALGKAVGQGEVGHILVRGPSVMQGYFQDPVATQAVIRDGWLWTGDLGFFGEGGLYVTGRAKDLIIIRGKNYYAEDVESVVERIEGTRPGGVVAFAVYDEEQATDLVVIVCETKVREDEEREKLAAQIGERVTQDCGFAIDEVVLVPPGTIPKTSSGKRQRGLCRKRYLEDELVADKTGKLRLAWMFVRSGVGFLRMLNRRMRQRPPSID